jgi:hypothetical protein
MPTIVQLSNCKICVFAGDHMPPHFHVRGPGWSASVSIGSLMIIKGHGPRRDLNEAVKWAMTPVNLYRLMQVWRRLNERD